MFTQGNQKLFNLFTAEEIPTVVWLRSTLNEIEEAREAGAPPMKGHHEPDFGKGWTYVKKDNFEMCYSEKGEKGEKMIVYIMLPDGTVLVAFQRKVYTNWRKALHQKMDGGEFLYDSTELQFMIRKADSAAASGSDREANMKMLYLAPSIREMKRAAGQIKPFESAIWDNMESKKAMTASWLNALKEPENFQYFKQTLDVEFLPCAAENMYFGARVRAAIKCGNVRNIEANFDDGHWGITATVLNIVEMLTAAEKVENVSAFIDEIADMGLGLRKDQTPGKKNMLGEILTELMKRIAHMNHEQYLAYVASCVFNRIVEDVARASKKQCV